MASTPDFIGYVETKATNPIAPTSHHRTTWRSGAGSRSAWRRWCRRGRCSSSSRASRGTCTHASALCCVPIHTAASLSDRLTDGLIYQTPLCRCDELAANLSQQKVGGTRIEAIHGDRDQHERSLIMRRFKQGEVRESACGLYVHIYVGSLSLTPMILHWSFTSSSSSIIGTADAHFGGHGRRLPGAGRQEREHRRQLRCGQEHRDPHPPHRAHGCEGERRRGRDG